MITRLYVKPSIAEELCFLIEHRKAFDAKQKDIVSELVQVIPDVKVTTTPSLLGSVVQVGPRISIESSWSSSAIGILKGCGIEAERFEIIRRHAIPKGVDERLFAESLFTE